MKKKMPYIVHDRKLKHPVKRKDIADLQFVQFLEERLASLHKLLPADFRKSLAGK